jgi:hypothetical protein
MCGGSGCKIGLPDLPEFGASHTQNLYVSQKYAVFSKHPYIVFTAGIPVAKAWRLVGSIPLTVILGRAKN